MKTESTLYDDDRRPLDAADKRAGGAASIARRIGSRLLHEVREGCRRRSSFLSASTLLMLRAWA